MPLTRSASDRRWYRFGPYVVDAPKRLLWRDHALVPITSKAFEILLLLVQRRDRVVDKQELLEEVWRRTAVEENTLTRHVSTLRKVLDERPGQHQYILTVPGHGYQFVAEVIELDERPAELLHSVAIPPPESTLPAAPRPPLQAPGHAITSGDTPAPLSPGLPDWVVVASGAERDATGGTRRSWVGLATLAGAATVFTALVLAALGADDAPRPPASRMLRQFTFLGGLQKDPAWSPDGRDIAYASEHAGNSDIFVQAIGDPTPRQITFSPAEESQPAWSPDGEWLAFRSEAEGGGLYLVSARGGSPRRLTRFGYRPQWSPTGGAILFSSSGHLGGVPKLHVIRPGDETPRPLRPDVLKDLRPVHVGWRPDGRAVSIWARNARDELTFQTVPLDGGAPIVSIASASVEQQRAAAGVTLDRFTWSPSGRHLYFEGQAQETRSLWRVTVDPRSLAWIGGPDRLTIGTTQDGDAALSPDGRRLVFSARTVRTRLWMFPFDASAGQITGQGQPVTSGAAGEQDADAPDDGSKLAYRVMRASRQQVWERTVADGRERLLVEADEWNRTRPRWSADGRRLGYLKRRVSPAGARGEAAVAVLSVDRNEERLLTSPGDMAVIPSDWSPDGRWLLGGCPQPGTRRVATCVVSVDQNGGTPVRVLTSDTGRNLFEQRYSPDQRWISFIAVDAADAGASTIYVMPAGGGPWTPITGGASYDDKPHWAPDGRTLYFVSPRDGVLNVWGRRIDPDTGTPAGSMFQVTRYNSPGEMISAQLAQMQIALTANRLFVPVTETQSELWLLEQVDR